MTPSARLSSVIELLDIIMSDAGPAEHCVRTYFRTRRYAGSKDRRWVTEFLFSLFRRLGEVDWAVSELALDNSSRTRALVALSMLEKVSLEDIQSLYMSGSYASEPLSEDENSALQKLESLNFSEIPQYAKDNFPAWLFDEIHCQYGEAAGAVLASYQERAPLTLRVNKLRSDRDETVRLLKEDGVEASATKLSPIGIILEERVNLTNHGVMERGLVEVQDEAAQISSLLADAQPGMQVTDFCAGAGGKSLAMAAEMDNIGQIYAFDINLRRMKDITIRCRRAGVHIIETHQLHQDERDEEIFSRLGETMSRVFVDAPCSGSGTWRRQPDQKWFFNEERLAELVDIQQNILEQASRLVAPGGRLIYATCSILQQENANQVSTFLEKHKDFSILPVSNLASDLEIGLVKKEDFLKLTPNEAGTDGFFTAILGRNL